MGSAEEIQDAGGPESGIAKGFQLIRSSSDIEHEMAIVKNPDSMSKWLDFYRFKVGEYQKLNDSAEKLENRLYQIFILERACAYLKRSYKLWSCYLDLRVSMVEKIDPLKGQTYVRSVGKAFEMALLNLNKFPRIWEKYILFLIKFQPYNLSTIRKVFFNALRSLPLTQHEILWAIYIPFLDKISEELPQSKALTTVLSSTYRKYVQFYPEQSENVIEKLTELGDYGLALQLYENNILNQSAVVSKLGKSSLEVYLEYSDVLAFYCRSLTRSKDAQAQQNLLKLDDKIQTFLLNLINLFPDQLGLIVVKLANYFILRGNFVKADDTFNKYLCNCVTIKDFKLIYDGLLEFKENIIKGYLDQIAKLEQHADGKVARLNVLLDIQMASFETLIKNRKHYIYDILLRQDINNCAIWLKKIQLYDNETELKEKLNCCVQAIKNIKPSKAHYDTFGVDDVDDDADDVDVDVDDKQRAIEKKESEKINSKLKNTSGFEKIWIYYAKIYENNEDIETARTIYNSAIKVPFVNANDLVEIYISWATLEISVGDDDEGFERGIKLVETALLKPDFKTLKIQEESVGYFNNDYKAQLRIHKSIKLWSFYLDLIESTEDFDRTCAAYDRVLKTKIVTPIVLVNYTNFLQDHQHYERSFQVFEKGLERFNFYPIKYEINLLYLTKFLERFKAIKAAGDRKEAFQYQERIRDLFEQAVSDCPSNLVSKLYELYADFEEKNSLSGKVILIFQQCIKHLHLNPDEPVPSGFFSSNYALSHDDKLLQNFQELANIYEKYVIKLVQFNGPGAARPIFFHILNEEPNLPNFVKLKFVLQFKDHEVSCKEIDRARAILSFGTGFVNYKVSHSKYKKENLQVIEEFWESWKHFELQYGNEDTYKDMLRARRNVAEN